MKRVAQKCLILAVVFLAAGVAAYGQDPHNVNLVFSCRADNDLYRLLSPQDGVLLRYKTPEEAIENAPEGFGVLLLADGYPTEPTNVAEKLFDLAHKKRLRIYIEFPSKLYAVHIASQKDVQFERAVVSSDRFGPALDKHRILSVPQARFVNVDLPNHDITLAPVAGFDKAILGAPDWVSVFDGGGKSFPLLAKHPLADILIGSTKLSDLTTARYAPMSAWKDVWQSILSWLIDKPIDMPDWTPSVRPSHKQDDKLPKDAEEKAFRRGIEWYTNARLLIHPNWQNKVTPAESGKNFTAPAPQADWPRGDGKLGILEGFASEIDYTGAQPVRCVRRSDTMSECAMALAFKAAADGDNKSEEAAVNLQDFIYSLSDLAKGPRSDSNSPSFGLIGRDIGAGLNTYCGDGNACTILGTLASAAIVGSDKWDEAVLRCLLANLRTTCVKGFREECFTEDRLKEDGWKTYSSADYTLYSPQSEAYLWACFLWAYKHTGYEPFIEKARTAIKMTMDAYPNNWRWTHGIQQERARMLLPLAWLVRVEDTPEHRDWLRKIAGDLIGSQVPSGGIREQLGSSIGPQAYGQFPPPQSNDEYGTRRAPVIQTDSDSAADLLYTMNSAFLGLHEAAAATNDAFYADAENKIAEFLCRVQISSRAHPELDGAWYRAFDLKKWEYWGSNADSEWGAWSIVAGSTQGWLTSVFALRQARTSLWHLTKNSKIGAHLAALEPVMFPGESRPKPTDSAK